MALPSPDEARTWGGKLIVDRMGATIGLCTQVYLDDATGLPEWATARMGNTSVVLPLVDAVEAQGRVQVGVRRDDVVRAPAVADQHHITEDEEIRLYEHYGIAYSRSPSGGLLPASEVSQQRGRAATIAAWTRDGRIRAVLAAVAVLAGVAAFVGVTALRRRRTAT